MPYVLRLRDKVLLIEQNYPAFKVSYQGVCWRGGRGGGGVLMHHKTASLMKELLFSWNIRGNYATKSKLAECVKRH